MKSIGFLFTLTFLLILPVLSQGTGEIRISGRITDGETGEVLPGASILIEGTARGTVTGLDGDYTLLVPGGETILTYSFLGYVDQQITVGDQRTINIRLVPDITSLDEVVITVQAKGQIGARQQQINSNTIKNVVSPERLQENPDANAVEAIGRLPGISVLRSGGEGSSLVIRGMEPKYSNVTLEGINLPATGGGSRATNISGISQYVLQGVEVIKALTPDMEANAVGGTVNLKLQETPAGLHFNVMAQGGYNNLNTYFGNYKFLGEISNRFLDNKLGIFFSANAERVNRSVETMSASYGLQSAEVDILLNSANLNLIHRIRMRQSMTLSMDYQVHPSTKIKLYGLYTHSSGEYDSQTKSYSMGGAGSVYYGMSYNPHAQSNMLHTALSGETKLDFLNILLDYGASFSIQRSDNPNSRSWQYQFNNSSSSDNTTLEIRRLDPTEVIPLFKDDIDSLHNTRLSNMRLSSSKLEDKNYTGFVDISVPYRLGPQWSGHVKFGGRYRMKDRFRDVTAGTAGTGTNNPYSTAVLVQEIPWLVQNGSDVTAVNVQERIVDDFLGGMYNFGWYFSYDRLNEITTAWDDYCRELYFSDPNGWQEVIPHYNQMGFAQILDQCMMDDQDIREDYAAGYIMTELNVGRWLKFIPGIRYEQTDASMKGFITTRPQYTGPIFWPLPGSDTSEVRSDAFWLPMVHLRISPIKSLYAHLAYTQTLGRPDFTVISPNYYYSTASVPYVYLARNPYIKTELWTNYDAQLTLHSNKLGLLSIGGFYKTVKDKIWARSFRRLSSDPPIPGYPENAVVAVSWWENHGYDIYLRGMELEWQTSFWYLPGFLKYFTFNANYTYTDSKTHYPFYWFETVIPPEGGRPTQIRVDSTATGPMLYQPKHIANVSLGFNIRGFNTWLSFQYNGEIYTSKNYYLHELDRIKENFYRIDLQMTYDLPLKIPGRMQILGNFANLSNFMETSKLAGDPRYTYQEKYGWTVDLGIRYRF